MTKYTFELEFNSINDKSMIIKIPHANENISNDIVSKAMQDIIDTDIVIYSIYQPKIKKEATLIETITYEYDLN